MIRKLKKDSAAYTHHCSGEGRGKKRRKVLVWWQSHNLSVDCERERKKRRRFILDYVFWTNFFQGSVYFRLVKTMYFGLSPGHVVFYTSLKECTLG